MKKIELALVGLIVVCVLGFFAIGCGTTETVMLKGPAGAPGVPGNDGNAGHSLVSLPRSASENECLTNGSAVDVYLDLDDSLTVSEGDTLQSGLVACHGAPGVDGLDGVDGSDAVATMTAYTITSSCQIIAAGYSAKKHDSDSVRIYSGTSCTGSSETMDEDNDEVYVLNSSTLLIFQDMVLRKLVFN